MHVHVELHVCHSKIPPRVDLVLFPDPTLKRKGSRDIEEFSLSCVVRSGNKNGVD